MGIGKALRIETARSYPVASADLDGLDVGKLSVLKRIKRPDNTVHLQSINEQKNKHRKILKQHHLNADKPDKICLTTAFSVYILHITKYVFKCCFLYLR